MKCPECGHEFEDEDFDDKVARTEFIKNIVNDINLP